MDKVSYWTDLADYDFDVALLMLKGKKYLYVGFMLHQVVEKLLKAYWSKVLTEPPLKIHTLTILANKTSLLEQMNEDQKDLLARLLPLNIEARYPAYKDKLLSQLNEEYCNTLISRTKEFSEWIKQKL